MATAATTCGSLVLEASTLGKECTSQCCTCITANSFSSAIKECLTIIVSQCSAINMTRNMPYIIYIIKNGHSNDGVQLLLFT